MPLRLLARRAGSLLLPPNLDKRGVSFILKSLCHMPSFDIMPSMIPSKLSSRAVERAERGSDPEYRCQCKEKCCSQFDSEYRSIVRRYSKELMKRGHPYWQYSVVGPKEGSHPSFRFALPPLGPDGQVDFAATPKKVCRVFFAAAVGSTNHSFDSLALVCSLPPS